jgi:hypothetical protein
MALVVSSIAPNPVLSFTASADSDFSTFSFISAYSFSTSLIFSISYLIPSESIVFFDSAVSDVFATSSSDFL